MPEPRQPTLGESMGLVPPREDADDRPVIRCDGCKASWFTQITVSEHSSEQASGPLQARPALGYSFSVLKCMACGRYQPPKVDATLHGVNIIAAYNRVMKTIDKANEST